MKIRNGFVSNSSSSSFIVIFDKRPKSIDELKQIMFPDIEYSDLIDYFDNVYPISDIVGQVWKDIQTKKNDKTNRFCKATKREIIGQLQCYELCNDDNEDVVRMHKEQEERHRKFTCFWEVVRNKYGRDFCVVLQEISSPWSMGDMYKNVSFILNCLNSDKEAILNKSHSSAIIRSICNFRLTHKDFSIDRKTLMSYRKTIRIRDKEQKMAWARESKLQYVAAEKSYRKFMEDNKGKWYCIFSYGDDDSFGSCMEHGEIFRNVNHIEISHH